MTRLKDLARVRIRPYTDDDGRPKPGWHFEVGRGDAWVEVPCVDVTIKLSAEDRMPKAVVTFIDPEVHLAPLRSDG
jgi:hypothetical protein